MMTSATRHAHQRPLHQWPLSSWLSAVTVPFVAAVMPQRRLMEVPTPRNESAQPMSTVPRTRMKDHGVAGLVAIEIPERVTEVVQIEIHPQGRLRS